VHGGDAHQTGVLRQALLLSDYRSILLRPRRMPEADDEGSSESGLVSVADTDGFDMIIKRRPESVHVSEALQTFSAETVNMLISTGKSAH
jgi:hypothetical protein